MQHSSSTFFARDGLKLFEQSWLPTGEAKASVLIVHGFGEHSTRYVHVAEHLTSNGYAVYTYDHRGHGQSAGRRAYIDAFDDYRTDLEQVIGRVQQQTPNRPLYLLGHSMGGAIVGYTAVTSTPKVAGFIFSSAAIKEGDDISPLLIRMSSVIGRYLPKLPTTKLDGTAISRDPAVVAKYDSDPLNYRGGFPARTAAELLRVMPIIQERAHLIKQPVLIFHGTADRLVNVEGSKILHQEVGSADKTLKLYDGLYHETMNEPEQVEVLQLITDWLDARVGEAQSGRKTHHQRRAEQKKG